MAYSFTQVEELKAEPDELKESAPALAAKQLDKELKASSSVALPAQVNDLTAVVKKKKKPAAEPNGDDAASSTKRKAEDDAPSTPPEKKAKLETEGAEAEA